MKIRRFVFEKLYSFIMYIYVYTVIILCLWANKATKTVSLGWVKGKIVFNNHFCSAIKFRMSSNYSAIWAVWNRIKLFQKMLHLHFRNEFKKIIFPLLHESTEHIRSLRDRCYLKAHWVRCYLLPNITEICLTLACKSLFLLWHSTLTDFSTFNPQITNLTFICAVEAWNRATVKPSYCSLGYVGQTLCSCGPIPAFGWGICLSQHLQAALWDRDVGPSSTVTKQPTSVRHAHMQLLLL